MEKDKRRADGDGRVNDHRASPGSSLPKYSSTPEDADAGTPM